MNAARCAMVAVVAGLAGLAWTEPDLRGARAQDNKQEFSDTERKDLEKQVRALIKEAVAHDQQGRLDDALRALEQCSRLQRQLYPTATFPDGHRDLAASLNA